MANAPVDPKQAHAAAIADVKRLMRLARTGALATLEAKGGAPLTTLLGVASDFDGAPLFLMSTLSRHTRNLAGRPARLPAADRPPRTWRPAEPAACDARRRGRTMRRAAG